MFCCILLAVALLFGARVAGARPWYNANFDGYSLASGSRIFPYNANNDAELDIITSSGNVILGMPNGDFSQGVGFTIPLSTYHMAIADQNGDGRKDVFLTGKPTPGAWGTFYLYTYQKLAGNGFTALPGIVLPEKSDVLHAGDFDGNGLADAVVFTRGLDFPDVPDTGAVYFSHPGGISPGVVFEIPMLYPIDSGVGDFDEDGRTDIVVLSAFNLNPRTLAFYLSSAGGILAAPRIDTLSTIFPGYIGVADVNDDGHDDIAFSDGRAPASFLGNGDGTFQPVYPPDVGPAWCGDLEFGDVNLDGHLDVVSNCTFNYAYIGLGDGAGRFSTVSRHWFPRGGSEESLIVNDFDHDGFGDIVGNRSPGLAVLRGNAAVTFNTVPEFPAAPNLSEVIALDWDLDGIEDLVGVDRIGGNLVLFRNRLGALEPGVTIPLGFIPDGIRFADLNGDGRRDIVAADQGADLVKVSLGSSGGGFQTPVSYPVGSDPSDVATGDFNADGILDVVVSNFSYPSWSASYLRGTGNGAFAPQVVIPTAATPSSIETGDFNEDGKLDFVTGHPFDRCSLVLGRGNGTFDPYIGVGTTSSQSMSPVRVGDLNRDGHLDLIGKRASGIGVRHGTGTGTFGSLVVYSGGGSTPNLNVKDLDGDDKLDLVPAGSSSLVSVRFGSVLGTGHNYGAEADILWVVPFAFDAGPSVELAVLVSEGPRFMILSHPDAVAGVPDLPDADPTAPFVVMANPARGTATFRMTSDQPSPAVAGIFDVAGRRVATIPSPVTSRGGEFRWSGQTDRGRAAAAGRYYAVLETPQNRWSIPFLWFP